MISPVDPIRVPQYSAAEIRVVTEEASRRGSYATAHAYSPEAITHSVLNGVRCIEHGNLLDAETARLMAENDVYLVPTLVTYDAMGRRGAEIGLTEVGSPEPGSPGRRQERRHTGARRRSPDWLRQRPHG